VAEVGVTFVAEEDVSAADVFVLLGGVGGVPVVAGEFVVGAGEEVVALSVVLADEQYEGRRGAVSERRTPFLQGPRREAKETAEGGAAACCAHRRNP
jgi:hypothetical protein